MATVYSYIRFSSKQQELGDSLRRQMEEGQKWIERHSHTAANKSYRDLGLSGFRGKHRLQGALGEFLKAIRETKVKAGDILLLEALDRLSREGFDATYQTVREILLAGVKIVCLLPWEMTYDRASLNKPGDVQALLMAATLGHTESVQKSERVSKFWAKAREQVQNGTALSRKCPVWLTGTCAKCGKEKCDCKSTVKKFKPNQWAPAIKFIFERTAEGAGQKVILHEVSKKWKGRHWSTSYLGAVLLNRAVLGEYQPKVINPATGKRIPDGKVIPNYYPAVVDENLWLRAQGARRKPKPRGPSRHFTHLFPELIFNAKDGAAMHLQTTSNKDARDFQRRLVSYRHLCGKTNADPVSVNYDLVENAVLASIQEIMMGDLVSTSPDAAVLDSKKAELAGIETEINQVNKMVEEADLAAIVPALARRLTNLQAKKDTLIKEIESIRISNVANSQLSGDEVLALVRGGGLTLKDLPRRKCVSVCDPAFMIWLRRFRFSRLSIADEFGRLVKSGITSTKLRQKNMMTALVAIGIFAVS